jgi:Serine carboxypeptidase
LAYSILTTSTDAQLVSNLKRGGLMLGNPVTDCSGAKYGGEDDINFMNTEVQSFYYHGMVSPRVLTDWTKNACDTPNPPSFSTCRELYGKANRGTGPFHQPLKRRSSLKVDYDHAALNVQVNSAGSLNPDDLYYSFCTGNATLTFVEDHVPDCFNVDDQSSAWLNSDAVQKALHVRPGTEWSACTNKLIYHRTSGSLIPYLENIFSLAPATRILYYAGDVDINTGMFQLL